jgi:peptidoglycan hydrolase CwlO-like protein
MSTVYNPEADVVAQIERLELEARNIRRKIERVTNENDKRVLNRQLKEIAQEIEVLRSRLP